MGTRRNLEAIEARRLEGARMLKQGIQQVEIARRLEVSRAAVCIWAKSLTKVDGSVKKLKAKPLGRPKQLDVVQCAELRKLLIQGALAAGFPTELWTIKRVCKLVQREFGVAYSQSGSWALLRSLGFTPQKPEKRATQRDEKEIADWKKKKWPALTKKLVSREER